MVGIYLHIDTLEGYFCLGDNYLNSTGAYCLSPVWSERSDGDLELRITDGRTSDQDVLISISEYGSISVRTLSGKGVSMRCIASGSGTTVTIDGKVVDPKSINPDYQKRTIRERWSEDSIVKNIILGGKVRLNIASSDRNKIPPIECRDQSKFFIRPLASDPNK